MITILIMLANIIAGRRRRDTQCRPAAHPGEPVGLAGPGGLGVDVLYRLRRDHDAVDWLARAGKFRLRSRRQQLLGVARRSGLTNSAAVIRFGLHSAPSEEIRFAVNSPLEGDGFEPSVPRPRRALLSGPLPLVAAKGRRRRSRHCGSARFLLLGKPFHRAGGVHGYGGLRFVALLGGLCVPAVKLKYPFAVHRLD